MVFVVPRLICFLLMGFLQSPAQVQAWTRDISKCYHGWSKDKLFGKSLVILGDSQGKALMRELEKVAVALSRQDAGKMKELKSQTSRCGLCQYLEVKCKLYNKWRKPPSTDIGPIGYGLKHHFCTDCHGMCYFYLFTSLLPFAIFPFHLLLHSISPTKLTLMLLLVIGCGAVKWSVQQGGVGEEFMIEFIPVEFAKDYIIQTRGLTTTQENVVAYLQASPPDYIIFNTGLHDIPYSTPEEYRANLIFYTKQLTVLQNTSFIWVETNYVNTKDFHVFLKYNRSYVNTTQYNVIANEVVANTLPNLIDTIDPNRNVVVGREFGGDRYYKDGHHFGGNTSYYNSIIMRALYSICATDFIPLSHH